MERGSDNSRRKGKWWNRLPPFSPDASTLYYLLRREGASGAELWRVAVDSGKSEAVFPGISMMEFDLSPDGKQVVYTTAALEGSTQLWVAPIDRSAPAAKVGVSGARSPHFGAGGQILFQHAEGNLNYLERVNADGSQRSMVLSYPILDFESISPGRRWVITSASKISAGLSSWNLRRTSGRRSPGAHLRRLLLSVVVAGWEVPGCPGGVAVAERPGMEFGDSAGTGGRAAESSSGWAGAGRRSQRRAGSDNGGAGRSGARQGPGALCMGEYDGTPEFVSDFDAVNRACSR